MWILIVGKFLLEQLILWNSVRLQLICFFLSNSLTEFRGVFCNLKSRESVLVS